MYWKMLLVTLVHACLGMTATMHATVLNAVEAHVRQFVIECLSSYGLSNPSEQVVSLCWALLNSMYPLGFLLGPLIIAYGSEKLGRRGTVMQLNGTLMLFASVLGVLAREYGRLELLLLSRLLSGMSDTIAMFIYVFLMECCAPKDGRLAGAIAQIGDVTWYVMGAAVSIPNLMGTEERWHWMLAIPAGVAILYGLAGFLVPESPKHLLLTLEDEERARKAVRFYYGPEVDTDVVLEKFREEALHVEAKEIGIRDVLSSRRLRWPFFICIVANVGSRITGYDINSFYSTEMLHKIGVPMDKAPLYNLLILRLPLIFIAIIFPAVVSCLNTRRLLFSTLLVGCVSITLMWFSETLAIIWPESLVPTVLLIGALALGICAFYIGGNFAPRILPGEICPQASRSLTSAWSTGASALTALIMSFSYAPLASLIGEMLTLLPLVLICWPMCSWLYKHVPDTHEKSINDVIARWVSLQSQTSVKSYKNNEMKLDGVLDTLAQKSEL